MNNIDKKIKFVVFPTKLGYFGLAGTKSNIMRSHLPVARSETIESIFLKEFPDAQFDNNLFKNLQIQIIEYFNGKNVDFSTEIPVFLNSFSEFSHKILTACRNIRYGQTVSYGDLAREAGFPNASRAVGNVLARNPIPLIIPCHRVIRSDGKIGGFSASGGTNLKRKLLAHEKHSL